MPIINYQNNNVEYLPPTIQQAYPTHVFPRIIGDAICEASMHLKVQVELGGQAALGVVSSVCQNFVNVQCPNFDPAPCSLFLMAASDSSSGKSLVEQRFLRAVSTFERKQQEDADAYLPIYRAKLKIWHDDDRLLAKDYRNAERGSKGLQCIREKRLLHEQNRPMEPCVRGLRYAELSPQGLRDMLLANGALGILSPEAAPVVNGRTFSQPATLSGYWSGEDRPVGLVSGNRRPVEPRLTISVMLQTAKFIDYMKSRGSDAFATGLLARFLVVAPTSDSLSWQGTCVEEVSEPSLELFNKRVSEILNQDVPSPYKRAVLRLSNQATLYWKLYRDAMNYEMNNEEFSEDIRSCFRKLAQQASRIAALFHYFEGRSSDISPEAMKGAIALCEWYTFEYVRIFTPYTPSRQQKGAEAAQKLLQWLQEATAESLRYPRLTLGCYTERDLRNYSKIRGSPEALENAIMILHRQGHVAVCTGQKGGRVIYYPASRAPISNPVRQSLCGQQWEPICNMPLDGATSIAAQNLSFRAQSMTSEHAAGNKKDLHGSVPDASGSVGDSIRTVSHKENESESDPMPAVIQALDKSAMEKGIGAIKVSVRQNRG